MSQNLVAPPALCTAFKVTRNYTWHCINIDCDGEQHYFKPMERCL